MLCKTLAILGGLGVMILTLPAQAQEPTPGATASAFKDERLGSEKDKPTIDEVNDLARLVRGNDALKGDRKAVMQKMARWLVYRLTWVEIQEGREPNLTMVHLMEGEGIALNSPEWNGALKAIPVRLSDNVAIKDLQQKYLKEFLPIMVPLLQDVMKNRQVIARVNAVRLMHQFAEADQEEIADELIKVIETPQEIDAVRHWAYKGLKALFDKPTADKSAPIKDAKRAERCGLVLYRALEKFCQQETSGLPDEEVEAIRYIRRELIRGVGNVRRPLIVEQKGDGFNAQPKREGPAAGLLLRIMNDENIEPKPTWTERVEAANALCHMKSKPGVSYQPIFALHQLGQFIAKLAAEKPASERFLKDYASRLTDGCALLKTELVAGEAGKFRQEWMQKVEPVLQHLFEQAKNPQSPNDLREWLDRTPPKVNTLYQPPLEGQ